MHFGVFALVLAVLATPLGAEAQEAGKVLRIGYLPIGYLPHAPTNFVEKSGEPTNVDSIPRACEAVFMTADRIIQ